MDLRAHDLARLRASIQDGFAGRLRTTPCVSRMSACDDCGPALSILRRHASRRLRWRRAVDRARRFPRPRIAHDERTIRVDSRVGNGRPQHREAARLHVRDRVDLHRSACVLSGHKVTYKESARHQPVRCFTRENLPEPPGHEVPNPLNLVVRTKEEAAHRQIELAMSKLRLRRAALQRSVSSHVSRITARSQLRSRPRDSPRCLYTRRPTWGRTPSGRRPHRRV